MPKQLENRTINPSSITELAQQQLFQEILLLGYSQQNILLNSNFLGSNGQTFLADIIVLPDNSILHINPILVINIIKLSEEFHYSLLKDWQDSGAKVLIWKKGCTIKVFALEKTGKYYELPPFIPQAKQIKYLANKEYYRLKSSLSPCYTLKSILANLHDHLYGNSNIRIPSKLGIEIQKLLLIKQFDEGQLTEQCEFCIPGQEEFNLTYIFLSKITLALAIAALFLGNHSPMIAGNKDTNNKKILSFIYNNAKQLKVCENDSLDISQSRQGSSVYELGQQKYLVQLLCSFSAYQGVYEYYLYSGESAGVKAKPLKLETFEENEQGRRIRTFSRRLVGLPEYNPQAKRLTIWTKSRGIGDCGGWAKYQWKGGDFKLLEYREKANCDGHYLDPAKYPRIY